MSAVLLVHAQPVAGAAAGRAGLFALERLGHPVNFVPTRLVGAADAPHFAVPDATVAALLAACASDGDLAAVLTGAFATPGQVAATADAIAALKAARPDTLYLCDPHLGASAADVAAAVARDLLPLADIVAVPPADLAMLAGCPIPEETAATLAAARALARPTVLVTAAPALMRGAAATLLVEGDTAVQAEHPALPAAPPGVTDLFAALFLARRLAGHSNAKALERAAAATFDMTARAARGGLDALPLGAEHDILATSLASVTLRQIGASARPSRAPKPASLG